MNDQENKKDFADIIRIRLDEIELDKQIQNEKYQLELAELEKEYRERNQKIEERKSMLLLYKKLESDSLTLEELEELNDNIDKLNLPDDELVVVMSKLVELSTLEYNKVANYEENEQEEVEIPVVQEEEIPAVQEEEKEIKEEISKKEKKQGYKQVQIDYQNISEEYRKIEEINQVTDKAIHLIYLKQTDIINNNKQNKAIYDRFLEVFGRLNNLYKGIEADYVFINKTNFSSKREVNDNYETIVKRLDELKKEMDRYLELYDMFAELYKKLEDILEQEQEEEIQEEIVEENIEEPEQNIEEEQEEQIEEEHLETEEQLKDIDDELLEEYESTYGKAITLLDNYNKIKFSNLLPENLYISRLFDTLILIVETATPDKINKNSIEAAIESLNTTMTYIEANATDELKEKLFPEIELDHINIGKKNIVIFLDNDGNYEIEKDFDDMVAGDRKKALKEFEIALKEKYTVRSWTNDLRQKSDHLKGTTVRIGNSDVEAWNCRVCSTGTRISLWPLSVNKETMEKLKNEYGLTDEFENIFLVCGIAINHKIDEHLKPQIRQNSGRIQEINDMFYNANTDFSEIVKLIDDSSQLCEKMLGKGLEK